MQNEVAKYKSMENIKPTESKELKEIIEKFYRLERSVTHSKLNDLSRLYKNIEVDIEYIQHYGYDKTGLPDLALKNSGGSVVSIGNTQLVDMSWIAKVTDFLKWTRQYKNYPERLIESSMHPGECFAFKGSKGEVLIQLAKKVS